MAELNKKKLKYLVNGVIAEMNEVFDTDHHVEEVYDILYSVFKESGKEMEYAEDAIGEIQDSFKVQLANLKKRPQRYLKNIDIKGL